MDILDKQLFFNIWKKGKHFQKLDANEQEIYDVMDEHIDYYVHYEIANTNELDYDRLDYNPFLHLSLHLSLNDLKKKDSKLKKKLDSLERSLKNQYNTHEIQHFFINKLIESFYEEKNKLKIDMEIFNKKLNLLLSEKLGNE